MASHLASFWKWDFLELGSGLLLDWTNSNLREITISAWSNSPGIFYFFSIQCATEKNAVIFDVWQLILKADSTNHSIYCNFTLDNLDLPLRDGPLEKLWVVEGNSRAAGIFFSLSNSLYEFFLAHSINIF